jgi:hypothetical protein
MAQDLRPYLNRTAGLPAYRFGLSGLLAGMPLLGRLNNTLPCAESLDWAGRHLSGLDLFRSGLPVSF